MNRQFLILIATAAFAVASTTNVFGQTGKTVKVISDSTFESASAIFRRANI